MASVDAEEAMSEKLERVRDFGELRAGLIVVGKPCGVCGGGHRGILLSFVPSLSVPGVMAWTWEPNAHPAHGRAAIVPGDVECGRIFRVADGLESPQTTERAKERVR